jgi:predicted ATPase
MEIHERLTAVVQLMEERKKLMGKFRQTQQMLIAERNRFVHLKGILTSEGRDVERLEGLTLISLFYTVLGTKEEAMQKERQEYLAAKLQYDECGAAIRDLEVELENLERELDAIGDPEAEYQDVLREKEDVLLQSGGLVAQQLFEIDEETGRLQAKVKELKEAIQAGEDLETALNGMEARLNSARNFGIWDILGGGLLVTAVKHLRISDAQRDVHKIQQLLRRFERELADVQIETDIGLGGFATFADYFFDGFIVDCIIQTRINSSLDCTREQRVRAQQIIAGLRQKLGETNECLTELHERRKQIIEKA